MIRKNKGWKEKALNLFKLMHNNSNQKAWKTSTVKREQEAHAEMPLLARVIVCFNVDLQDKSQHPLSVGLLYTGQQNPFCWLKMHEQMIRATQWWCDHLLRYHHMPRALGISCGCPVHHSALGKGQKSICCLWTRWWEPEVRQVLCCATALCSICDSLSIKRGLFLRQTVHGGCVRRWRSLNQTGHSGCIQRELSLKQTEHGGNLAAAVLQGNR